MSVLEILVSEKSLDFSFGEFGLGKSFGFGKFGLGKIVSVLVLENLVSKKKKIKITRKKVNQGDSAILLFEF